MQPAYRVAIPKDIWRRSPNSTPISPNRSPPRWKNVRPPAMQRVGNRSAELDLSARTLSHLTGFHRRNTAKHVWYLQSLAKFLKNWAWSLPTKILNRVKDWHIQPQGGQGAKQQSIVP